MHHTLLVVLLAGSAFAVPATAIPADPQSTIGNPQSAIGTEDRLARDILKELVEINTTDSIGDNTKG